MSASPTGTDGGNSLAERIAGLEGCAGCFVTTLVAILAMVAWLWINANMPAAGPLSPPATATRPPPITQSASLPLPPLR